MLGISKLEAYGIGLLIVILAAAAFGIYQRHEGRVEGRAEVQVKFDQFVNETKAAGIKAQQDALDKEKQYATNLATATASRNDALARLQLAQSAASAGRRASAANPTAPAGSAYVCIESKAYDAAFQQFGKRLDEFIPAVRGIAIEGDKAQIDAESMIRAWPTPSTKVPEPVKPAKRWWER